MIMRIAISLSLALAVAACGDKDEENTEKAPAAGKAQPAAAGTEQPAAAEPAGPPALTAPEFFADYSTLQGMEVLDRYGDGVVVSGTVLRTIEEMDGSLVVWLDAGDGNWVSLGFTDKGAAAKDKGVAADSEVTAACKVGGAMDKYIMNIDCELK
jgi:hypothetical protein